MKREQIWLTGIGKRWSDKVLSEPPAVAGGQFVIIRETMSINQEEVEEIRAFDIAKASNDESIPFAEAVEEIEDESDYNN